MFFLLLFCQLLCQCTKAVNSPAPVAVNKKIMSPYSIETATYLARAKNQEGADKQKSLIMAAGRMISDGQWQQGAAILAQTNNLTFDQLNEKNILLAKIDLIHDKPQLALDKLINVKEADRLTLYHQIQFHELLAQVYRSLAKPVKSVSERIRLEQLLTDNTSQMDNRRILWLTLIGIQQEHLSLLIEESKNDSMLLGWLELALISHQYRDNSKSLLAALDQWQMKFHNHPANHILPNPLDSVANKLVAQPKQIALLLPLSGPLAGPGTSVQDGFRAAVKANKVLHKPKIKVYDTAKGNILEIYQQAIIEGAEFIVGPLTKNQVASISAIHHPVPTLLLNDSEAAVEDNSYLFGLSPTHEAIQVALKAHNKGYNKALVIAPSNEWGHEVTKAFSQEWQANGGQIADTFLYAANDDLNKKIRDFLQITHSQEREKQIKQQLGYHLQTVISRRQDFDMIFLLAYPSKARQIIPLLKYYYAGNMPVYATSSVYGGNANALKDKDLDGVIFCDMPWVFSHQMGSRNWPEQFNSYNRLYALGMDSYALATQLNQLLLFPADGNKDQNGIFYLQSTQQVARVLEWGQFRQGLAHSLGDTV